MNHFDLILVGTGFASSFFLRKYLEKRPKDRVLVLERGWRDDHAWRLANHAHLDEAGILSSTDYRATYLNLSPRKPWIFTPSFGGGSNCWWACAPRFLPNDFRLRTAYGVGMDWPIGYDDLEPYYGEAEAVMAIAGSQDATPFPMSRPYPQPPHRLNQVERLLEKHYPGQIFPLPAARPTRSTAKRPRCCATGVCSLCPIDSKFTVLNEMAHLYERPNVELALGAQALSVDLEGGIARAVVFERDGREEQAHAALIALGANPIFNAHLLLRSGLVYPALGRNLCEQVGLLCRVRLAGIDNLDGSTSVTGHGYMLYDGEHRRERAACLIESMNLPVLRMERGRFGQHAEFKFLFEDLPAPQNQVKLSEDSRRPAVRFRGHSDYVDRAMAWVRSKAGDLLSVLPLEDIDFNSTPNPTEGHILGTARMGQNAVDSVVNRFQRVHGFPNLLCLGGSSFPSIAPANPTLTIAALSLWSAEQL